MELDVNEMELLEEIRQKLNLVEAYWWFAENSIDGFCCSNTVNAKKKFEEKYAGEVFDLMALLVKRKEDNG